MRFKWLVDYQELNQHIQYLKWDLNKSKVELARWVSGDLSNIKLEKGSRSSSLEKRIESLECELRLLVKQLDEMKLLIDSFTGIENRIVVLKYVEGKTLEQIAEEIGYSTSYIRSKHAEIKRTLTVLDGYDEKIRKYESETSLHNS